MEFILDLIDVVTGVNGNSTVWPKSGRVWIQSQIFGMEAWNADKEDALAPQSWDDSYLL